MRRSISRSVQSSGSESTISWKASASPIDDSVQAVATLKGTPRRADLLTGRILLTRATLMRFRRAQPTAQPAGRLRRALLPGAAVGLGMLWACVVAVAAAGVQGTPLLLLSAVAVLATAALLPLAHRHQA